MSDPKDPNDSPKPPGTMTVPPESGLRALFVSSRPPVAAEDDRTLGRAIAALLGCQHPPVALSGALVLEPDGGTVPIRWCGACGTLGLPYEPLTPWISPGLLLALRESGLLQAVASDTDLLAEALAETTRAVRTLRGHLAQWTDPEDTELLTEVRTIEDACAELERGVRFIHQALRP